MTAAALVVSLAVAQAIDFGAFNLRITWLDADQRLSVFAIASLLAQAATAAVSIRHGNTATDRHAAWFGLGILLGLLVVIRALTKFNDSVLGPPLVCVFALLVVLTWRDRALRQVVWGALLLLVLSLILHKVGPDADSSTASDYTWTYQVVGIIKHGAELAGWTLMAAGIAASIAATRSVIPVGVSPPSACPARMPPGSD